MTMNAYTRIVLLAVASLAVVACGETEVGQLPPVPAPKRVLGISASPRTTPPPTPQDYADAGALARDAGARGHVLTAAWSSLEPTAGTFNLATLRNDLSYLAADTGATIFVGLQVINTTARELPADLAGLPFSDARVKARFRALLDSLLPQLRSRVAYVSIGNEVDVYLKAHPEERSAYKGFYDDMVRYLRSENAGARIGVTATFDGTNRTSYTDMQAINDLSDVWIFTYYPLNTDFTPRTPDAALADIQDMVAMAAGKPVVLQEVGYPASAVLGSSDGAQATFVRNVFSAWYTSRARIPFLNYFLLHDFPAAMCDTLARYYGLAGNANFVAYLATLGLRTADGTLRAGWDRFVEEGRKVAAE